MTLPDVAAAMIKIAIRFMEILSYKEDASKIRFEIAMSIEPAHGGSQGKSGDPENVGR